MITGAESLLHKALKETDLQNRVNEPFEKANEPHEMKEATEDTGINDRPIIEPVDISFIERVSHSALIEQCSLKTSEDDTISKNTETKLEGLTAEEKAKIKDETGWSDEIIDNIKNMKQYEILKNAGLVEVEINGRKCLIREDIDLDYTDEDGVSNRDRMARGRPPLDSTTGQPIELHHLGQKAYSPLVELTKEEHRTGEFEDGKKNQSLWHDNTIETEVHGEDNSWKKERENHWKERAKNSKEW